MNILVEFNGSLHSRIALRDAVSRVREHGGKVIVLLPISGRKLWIGYEDGSRAEVTVIDGSPGGAKDARTIIESEGGDISARIIFATGDPGTEIMRYVRQENIDVIFSPHSYNTVTDKITCQTYVYLHEILTASVAG